MFEADYSRTLSTILSTSFLNLFTSLLRPLRTNTDELSAAEKLREIAVARADPDLEKTLTQILSAFETDSKILQKITHLVQWVTHLILWQTTNVKTNPIAQDEISNSRQEHFQIFIRWHKIDTDFLAVEMVRNSFEIVISF